MAQHLAGKVVTMKAVKSYLSIRESGETVDLADIFVYEVSSFHRNFSMQVIFLGEDLDINKFYGQGLEYGELMSVLDAVCDFHRKRQNGGEEKVEEDIGVEEFEAEEFEVVEADDDDQDSEEEDEAPEEYDPSDDEDDSEDEEEEDDDSDDEDVEDEEGNIDMMPEALQEQVDGYFETVLSDDGNTLFIKDVLPDFQECVELPDCACGITVSEFDVCEWLRFYLPEAPHMAADFAKYWNQRAAANPGYPCMEASSKKQGMVYLYKSLAVDWNGCIVESVERNWEEFFNNFYAIAIRTYAEFRLKRH